MELHRHFLRRAQEAEAAATRRKQQIRAREERDLQLKFETQPAFWRGRSFENELTNKTNNAASKDPIWKGHVEDNKWFISQATMHGIAALVDIEVARRRDELMGAPRRG